MQAKKAGNRMETRTCEHLHLHFRAAFEEMMMDSLHSSRDIKDDIRGWPVSAFLSP